MKVRGLHDSLPSSLIAGRWLAVLVCYLDDSGSYPQNSVTTLAGFLAREFDWLAFEQEVEPIFEHHGVSALHATDLEQTRGEFKQWKVSETGICG